MSGGLPMKVNKCTEFGSLRPMTHFLHSSDSLLPGLSTLFPSFQFRARKMGRIAIHVTPKRGQALKIAVHSTQQRGNNLLHSSTLNTSKGDEHSAL
eukprot:scaffold102483_cov16-Tisochrysis_lutea.AAC.1